MHQAILRAFAATGRPPAGSDLDEASYVTGANFMVDGGVTTT